MAGGLRGISPNTRLYRVGRAPDPWAWPDWSGAAADGTFGNRWDDSLSAYREAEVGLDEGLLASPGPDARERAEARQEADRQLACLSPEQARIVVDAKVWRFEYGEIAGALAKSADAVKQTASRSLRRLRAAPGASE